MWITLLAVIALASLGPSRQAGDAAGPSCIAREQLAADVGLGKVAARLTGRVLGSLVRHGMTMGQVDRILGSDALRLESGCLTGSFIVWNWHYYAHGLTVSFTTERTGLLRVDRVTFLGLLD